MAHAGGRPPKYTKEIREKLLEAFDKYIDDTPMSIIAEFAYKNDVSREELYDWPEFATLLKKCVTKKEAYLEKEGVAGNTNPAVTIFSLKQLGWRDRHEIIGNLTHTLYDGKSTEELKKEAGKLGDLLEN